MAYYVKSPQRDEGAPTAFAEHLIDKQEQTRSRPYVVAPMLLGVIVGVCFTVVAMRAPATGTIALFGPSGECPGYTRSHKLHSDDIRAAAADFVETLGPEKARVYYPDAGLQRKQWQLCTIVQQCLHPDYGLAVGKLSPRSRTKFFEMLAVALSDESYKRIITQHLSNLLLGEMQSWAVRCAGHCSELHDPDGLLPDDLLRGDHLPHKHLNASQEECAKLRYSGRYTLWECDASPRMLHHGNIDTQTGRYQLGNVFDEQTIHARSHNYDFVAIYGSLAAGEPFGFRYSGHHFDLSLSFDADGALTDLPTFIGHNPLVVPRRSPPGSAEDAEYVQWRNMAGIPQFPDAVHVMLKAAAVLDEAWYVPLSSFDSTPANGGLTLRGGVGVADVPHLRLSTAPAHVFDALWALVDYTLEFPRGAAARPEREAFRQHGRMLWTTVAHEGETPRAHLPLTSEELSESRVFLYVRIETDELLFFSMVNSLFSLMLEDEPSNHLHSILLPKDYLG